MTSQEHFILSRKKESERLKAERIGLTKMNNQGSTMTIIEYINATHLTVQFQDQYKYQIECAWKEFNKGSIKNPYYPSVLGVGMIGTKYPAKIDNIHLKEYKAWRGMLERCYSQIIKIKRPTYQDVTCCKEWLVYENFYEWLHKQENFEKWLIGDYWAVDKDILIKGNKIYSPETCCLVPPNINSVIVEQMSQRGDLPVGVKRSKKKFIAVCSDTHNTSRKIVSKAFNDPLDAYKQYKIMKKQMVQDIAKEEFNKGNVTEQCYTALLNYQVIDERFEGDIIND